MLSSILSDIASRMLTRNDEEDRIANFASQVADDMGNEGAPFFKPDENYTKNKKIAIQLAKRYIDDYKKMQQNPAYADEVRQDPSKFAPKKDRQGKAKDESEGFEKWTNRVESKVIEGINSLPDEDHAGENFSKLKDVMSKHFPVGTEGVNAVTTLQGLGFGDDDLFDQLGELAEKEGPDACACDTVKNYIMNTLLKSPNIQNYYTPEQITALQDAASASDQRTEKQPAMAGQESVSEAANKPIMIDGKEVDMLSIEYEMQDVGDNIFDLQGAQFTDGTDLSDVQMEKLEADADFNELVQQDHAERYADAMQEAEASIDDQYRFRDWLKKTHNKQVHELKPQEYAEISKQYRDEQGTKTEGNEFAQAVQKAKAAGMKPGDKFKVADKEYTLKDAIELAGMQLEDFDFAAESVGGGPTVRQMSDLELANFLHTSVAEVKKDREAAEEAAMEINQKYSEDKPVKEDELAAIKRLSGI